MSKIPLPYLKFPLHFFLLLSISLPSQVISQATTAEQTILLNIKQQLGNPPSLQPWSASSPPCNWPEIRCTGGTVTDLILEGKNITGKLPAAICYLKNLTQLDLSDNSIIGEFPPFLYNCSNLQLLDLSQNYFTGPIPKDIAKLTTLNYLDLGGNNFSGDVPAEIGSLSELQTLLLYRNEFNGTFPKEIGNLTKLLILGLAYNDKFVETTLPFQFGNLSGLTVMWMPRCNLIGEIPDSFVNLTRLLRLDLSFNRLTGNIPSGLFSLTNLRFLLLYHNELSGKITIPRSTHALNLTQVDLSMNNLTGFIPEDFAKLENLTVLHLFSNQLSGEIPRGLGLSPNLKDLKLFSNKLNGTLPPELGLYSKLESFEVGDNQLSGELPQHLCAGGALQGVIAFSNNFSGELPNWLGNCTSLRTVQLYNNMFSGEVPLGLWTLRNLSTLMLTNNSFSGQLPVKLSWNMSRLEIRNNRFSGQISVGISSAVNLVVFDARDNSLSGEIPSELTGLSKLNTLMLDGNQLSGVPPPEIISWESLNTLSLSRNKLSGQIPAALCNVPDLVYLDLAENNISGEIPPQLGNLRLIFLNLSSNKLSGNIPDEFNNLAYQDSFVNNPNLCAYDSNLNNLSSCLTKKAITPKSGKSFSTKYLPLILVLTIVVFLLASTLLVFHKLKRNWGKNKNHCGRDNLSTWKLTSFQRLDFTELNIFSSLIDSNLIGSGGFGKVYRVASDRPGEYVAVKKIRNCRDLDDEKLEKEFMAEVQILGSIRHSNIVKLLCCFSSENSKLLVYEYMENQSLDKWLHGRKKRVSNTASTGLSSPNKNCMLLNWPTRLKIAIGAAQGLCYMHHECSPPIIHRDVKSSNILLDSEFRASVADFGLAKMLAKPGELHTMSNIAGSIGYIPPEYAYSTKINEKADVYSFGVVLLELVTGKEPVSGGQHTTSNLVDWAWQHHSEGKCFTHALDEEIKETSYVEEMTTLFKLGLVCTSRLLSNRPSMKEVLQVLRQCCHPPGYGCRRVGIGFDVAPFLCDTTYISSYKDSNTAISENEESCLYSQ